MERLLSLIHKEFGNLHRAALLLGAFAFLSQILALVRDRFLASSFGAGGELDIYYAAFRIPDFLYVSVASLVSLTVLIPFMTERMAQEGGEEKTKQFLSNVFSFFLGIILFVGIILFICMPALAHYVVPGFDEEAQKQFILLSRILLLSPLLLGISSIFGSVSQIYQKFFVYALAPVLYNVGIIIGIILFAPAFGLEGIVWGVVLGACLHLLIQLPVVFRHNMFPRIKVPLLWSDIRDAIFLSIPRTLALSASHITLLVLIGLGSVLTAGSISVFTFAHNLQSVPLSIIGVSYSVAAFPTLARLFSEKNLDLFRQQLIVALRHIVFWSIPAIVLFIVLRAQIVRTVLGTGNFDWTDTRLVAASLALFSLSIVAQAATLLFVRALYAAGKTKMPLIVNTISSFFIIILGFSFLSLFESSPFFRFFLESLLRVDDVSGTAVIVLPLAFSLGMILNAGILFVMFKRMFPGDYGVLERVFTHAFSSSIIMGFVAYKTLVAVGEYVDINTFFGIFSQGAIAGIVGVITWFLVLRILGNPEIEELRVSLKGKFLVRPIPPDQEAVI